MKYSKFLSLFFFVSVCGYIFGAAFAPFTVFANEFSAAKPTNEEMLKAIIIASSKTRVRPQLLYGLLGQETAFGNNLGKTESEWNAFCQNHNTQDCRNWKLYDCKDGYGNARFYDEILRALGFTDSGGKAEKKKIPTSSTCALGFTQFEPNTWWQVSQGRALGERRVLNPWDINDAVLAAAYYLEDLGADVLETADRGEVIGSKDRIALQKYYCGANYVRFVCVEYARSIAIRSRNAPPVLFQEGLKNQLEYLRRQEEEQKERLRREAERLRQRQIDLQRQIELERERVQEEEKEPVQDIAREERRLERTALAFTRDDAHVYFAGRDVSGKWRIEKRRLDNGAPETTFGVHGAALSDAYVDTGNRPLALAVDGAYLYIAGHNAAPANYIPVVRIEKRLLSSGALHTTFGDKGVVEGDGRRMAPKDVIVHPSGYLFVAGITSDNRWRIEKRTLSNGALETSFGDNGAVTSDFASVFFDYPNATLAIEADSTHLYIIGNDQFGNWRIEKRHLGSGALDFGFGDGGAVTGEGRDAHTLAIDWRNMYVGGGYYEWRIEKRFLSHGMGDTQFGVGGIISEINGERGGVENIAVDATYLYAAGTGVAYPGNRVEKRWLSNGTLEEPFGIGGIAELNISHPRFVAIDARHLYVAGKPPPGADAWGIERRFLEGGDNDSAFRVFASAMQPGIRGEGVPLLSAPQQEPRTSVPDASLPVASDSPPATIDGEVPALQAPPPPAVPPIITTRELPVGNVGESYRAAFDVESGKAPYRWRIVSGSLPVGLTFDTASGTISGIPSLITSTKIVVRVSDDNGRSDAQEFRIEVIEPLVMITSTLPPGTNNASYDAVLYARGGTPPYTWSMYSGKLPPELALEPYRGTIYGTLTQVGFSGFYIEVTDSKGLSAKKVFSIETAEPLRMITGPLLPPAATSTPYVFTLEAAGGVMPYRWSVDGEMLPEGLMLDAAGIISGIPTKVGINTFSVQVSDAQGRTKSDVFSVNVY